MDRMIFRLLSYTLPSFLVTYLVWYAINPTIFNQFCVICFLLVISWTLGYYFYEKFNQENVDSAGKIVLVTGCDTGFGNSVAQELDKLGFHVYAGVLFPDGDGAKSLKSKCPNVTIVKMDVTNANEVSEVVEKIKAENKPLWAIVNNAGIGLSAPFDWGNDIETLNKMFDVNVFGLVRVTKACIPLLRQSRGRIINIASLACRLSSPWISHYCMTKHSVRVFSDSIRRELGGSGIRVITIEPAFYRTEIINFDNLDRMRNKLFSESMEEVQQYYGETFLNYLSFTNRMVHQMSHGNIDLVTNSIVNGVIRKHPKLFYRCCSYLEVLTLWATSHLPEILIDVVVTFQIDKLLQRFKAVQYQDKKFN